MSSSDPDAATAAARKLVEASGISRETPREIPGFTAEDRRAAMEYPGVAEEIERLVAADRASVQAGAPAPDFNLARMTGPQAGERITLSDHFGKRSVALVFGSYT